MQDFVDSWLSFELLFAVTTTCLLANAYLLVHITFGGKIITSLSVKPYMISFCLFTLMALESLWICYVQHVTYGPGPKK